MIVELLSVHNHHKITIVLLFWHDSIVSIGSTVVAASGISTPVSIA